MTPDADRQGLRRGGLEFFGRMSASISHEFKNVLAVINENAGLLDDYTRMAAQGRPADPEKLVTLTGRVLEQVKRGDRIARTMNEFAHSSDHDSATVDLARTAALMIALAARTAASRETILNMDDASGPNVTTNPFCLEQLIFACFEALMDVSGPGATLNLTPGQDGETAFLRISGPAPAGDAAESVNESATQVIALLGADVTADGNQLTIRLPKGASR